MPSINKCFVFLALMLTTATALSHGQIAHQGVARSVVADLTKKDGLAAAQPALRRRGSNSKHCKPRPSSSSSSSSSSTSSSHHYKATPPAKIDNNPPESSSSSSSSSHHHHFSAEPTSSSYNKPKPSPKSGGGGGGGHSGHGIGTYFLQHGTAGACGTVHPDSAMIVALQTETYAGGALCGKTITITNLKNGKTASGTCADECPTCDTPGSVDLSQGMFSALGGTEAEGEFDITWVIG